MLETKEIQERVILIAVKLDITKNHSGLYIDVDKSLDELEDLVRTAGAISVGRITQNRESVHPGTYIGKGKLEELREMIYEMDVTGIVCDDELSPAQMGNLEAALQVKIMDRTLIILDIFAARANTSEGKIQVELAQLKYRSSRLVGLGRSLSRLAGGIGTKGPGETKLEMDRRLIQDRMAQLRHELADVVIHRELTRTQRRKTHIPVVAIVGYTNAGKSTLLNTLTNADVLEEDKLFATLDPTTRNLELESGQQILLTDTVGFISKLPHNLVEAFKSTLEEAIFADIIIHVVDASNPSMETQMHVVYETLDDLGLKDTPIITAFNKIDVIEDVEIRDIRSEKSIRISAKKSMGMEELKSVLEDILRKTKIYLEKVVSYDSAGQIALIRKYGQLLFENYQEDGIAIKAYVPIEIYDKIK